MMIYMKNIKTLIILLAAVLIASCSKTYKVEDADASFTAYQLDGDKVRLANSTSNLTVKMFTKTINGVDQKVAFVEFVFTGKGDLQSIWTGDSCRVRVPSKVDGAGNPLAWEYKVAASDYERFKNKDYTQKGNSLSSNKNLIYTYWKAGTYKATMISSNWGEMDSDESSRDEKTITIKVEE